MRTACYIIAMLISIVAQELAKVYFPDDIKLILYIALVIWVSFLLGAASEIFRK